MSERFDLDTGVPVGGTAPAGRGGDGPAAPSGGAPAERRTPVTTRRATRPPLRPSTFAARTRLLPLVLAPSLLLVLGAVLSVLAWIGYANPELPLRQSLPYWPWQLFRSGLDQGGAVVFPWDREHVQAVVVAVLALLLVIAAILRPSRGRAAFVLVVAAAAAATYAPDITLYVGSPWQWTPPLAVALALGAVVRRAAFGGGRTLVAGAGLLLAATLLLPDPQDLEWHPPVARLVEPFAALLQGKLGLGREHLLASAAGWRVLGLAATVVLGALALVGVRGRWPWVAVGLLVLATAAVPPLAASLADLSPGPSTTATPTLVGTLARPDWLVVATGALALILSLGALFGGGGSRLLGAAGAALFVLVLVVTSAHWCASLGSAQGAPPFFRGLVGTTPWLGPGLGALLAPLAAALLDSGR